MDWEISESISEWWQLLLLLLTVENSAFFTLKCWHFAHHQHPDVRIIRSLSSNKPLPPLALFLYLAVTYTKWNSRKRYILDLLEKEFSLNSALFVGFEVSSVYKFHHANASKLHTSVCVATKTVKIDSKRVQRGPTPHKMIRIEQYANKQHKRQLVIRFLLLLLSMKKNRWHKTAKYNNNKAHTEFYGKKYTNRMKCIEFEKFAIFVCHLYTLYRSFFIISFLLYLRK